MYSPSVQVLLQCKKVTVTCHIQEEASEEEEEEEEEEKSRQLRDWCQWCRYFIIFVDHKN